MDETPAGSISVLHVDDEVDLAETVSAFVERTCDRIDVTTVSSTDDALDRLATDDVDCVVSDCRMPGMDGREFLRTVRDRDSEIPFIFFTGHDGEELAADVASERATDYLQKRTDPSQYARLTSRIVAAVERRRAQRRANGYEESVELPHRALFEDAVDPMVQFAVDDGTPAVTAVNDAFEETFGEEATAVVGRPLADVLVPDDQDGDTGDTGNTGDIGGDGDTGDTGDDGVTGDTGEDGYTGDTGDDDAITEAAVAGEHVRCDVHRRTPDGERRFQLLVDPFEVDGSEGGFARYVDVTGRDDPTDECRAKANLFDQLLEQLPAAMYVKDREARHLYMSHYDTDPEEVLGKTDPEIYGDDEFTRETYEDDLQVIETGEPIINREEYNDENGEWTLTSKVPWYGEDGEIQGLIGVTRFITEKKEYEQELRRQNERLEKFASVLSHDLRNPLNVAFGHLDLARQKYDDGDLDRVETALDRIDALIGDILELARKGQEALEPETVRLEAMARRAWENTRTSETALEIEDDLVIRADEARISELFENLFANAHEHADPTTVRVGVLTGKPGFYVADDGAGFESDADEELFRPGFSTTEDGTGFGLAIVAEIVENHGWEIDATESVDGGARFEITGVRGG